MIHQQDPVGLVTFDEKIRDCLLPKSRRSQLANVLSHLSQLQPDGQTDIAMSLGQLAAMLKQRSLVMVFSDFLTDTPPVFESLRRLRHGGHDVILFHVLDEAEVTFPFDGMVELQDPESDDTLVVEAEGFRQDYAQEIAGFREEYAAECRHIGVDYVPLDTSMQFDRALMEYLMSRRSRF